MRKKLHVFFHSSSLRFSGLLGDFSSNYTVHAINMQNLLYQIYQYLDKYADRSIYSLLGYYIEMKLLQKYVDWLRVNPMLFLVVAAVVVSVRSTDMTSENIIYM